MVKDWENIILKNEIDKVIKHIILETGAAYVKPLIINKHQKVITFFKSEENMMKALGKTILKDERKDQWQVRIQGDKFKNHKKTNLEDVEYKDTKKKYETRERK